MTTRKPRREFLREAAGLTVLASGGSALGFQVNQKLNIAQVGVSGRGSWFIQSIPGLGETYVALCDVNDQKAAEACARFPDARKFRDFRRMLGEMKEGIDAVIVAAPDHVHAAAAVAAMRQGKHVYVEKPLAHDVFEARLMRAVAKEHRVATQMGNQGTASPAFRRALELLRGGALGDLREVHVWNNNGGSGRRDPPKGEQPVPEYLQWDLWLGPAADRPFHREWMQGWQNWRDFGTGTIGNWASHTANLAFMALDLASLWKAGPGAGPRPLLRVEAKVPEINMLSYPKYEVIRWDVPARGALPPIAVTWHNGSSAPGMRDRLEELLGEGLDWGDKKTRKWQDFAGLLFVGSKGKLHATGHNATFRLLPEEAFRDVQTARPEKLAVSPGHEKEWLGACRGGESAWSSFDYSGPLEEFLLLGNVATRFEGKLDYDPVEGKVVNHEAADRALKREYRAGWAL